MRWALRLQHRQLNSNYYWNPIKLHKCLDVYFANLGNYITNYILYQWLTSSRRLNGNVNTFVQSFLRNFFFFWKKVPALPPLEIPNHGWHIKKRILEMDLFITDQHYKLEGWVESRAETQIKWNFPNWFSVPRT